MSPEVGEEVGDEADDDADEREAEAEGAVAAGQPAARPAGRRRHQQPEPHQRLPVQEPARLCSAMGAICSKGSVTSVHLQLFPSRILAGLSLNIHFMLLRFRIKGKHF